MKISIIIITWNAVSVLRNCLVSLEEIMKREDVEIILVDNGSQDGTVSFIKETYPHIKLISLVANMGVAYARNRGLEKASGKYLFILDNDTVAGKEAIEGMEAFMDGHSEVGICGCKLIDADNRVQESCRRYPGISEKLSNLRKPGEYRYSYDEDRKSAPFEPEYLIGACQFIRREAFEAVGLLDQHIFYGPEDADFCLRVKKAGWSICYLPQYSIIHLCQRRTNKKLFSKLARKHAVALLYFYWKHKRLN